MPSKRFIKPNGADPVEKATQTNIRLMSAARFRMATANAIDQHAAVLGDLDERLRQLSSFVADLSVRADRLTTHVTTLLQLHGDPAADASKE